MTFLRFNTYILYLILFVIAFYVIKFFIKHSKTENYHMIRNFKSKHILWIYVYSFLVYVVGTIHDELNGNILNGIIEGFKVTVEAIVMKLQLDSLENAMRTLCDYRVLVYITFFLTVITSILFIINFVLQEIVNKVKYIYRLKNAELCVIIGFNKTNYEMANDSKNAIVIDAVSPKEKELRIGKSITDEIKEEMFLHKIAFKSFDKYNQLINYLNRLTLKRKKRSKITRVIINTNDESKNVELINEIYKQIEEKNYKIIWESSDNSIAEVEDGRVIGKKAQEVVIKAYKKEKLFNIFDIKFGTKKYKIKFDEEYININSDNISEILNYLDLESDDIVSDLIGYNYEDKNGKTIYCLKLNKKIKFNITNLNKTKELELKTYDNLKEVIINKVKQYKLLDESQISVCYHSCDNDVIDIKDNKLIIKKNEYVIITVNVNFTNLDCKEELRKKKNNTKYYIGKPITLEYNDPILTVDALSKVNYYVLGSYQYKSIYESLIEKSKGLIHYINKHRLIADMFEYKYPLNKYMNECHIDYDNALLKDVNLNVFYLGFGKVNKELLINSICNNQFIAIQNNEKTKKVNENIKLQEKQGENINKEKENHKPVNYYIYEKTDDNKNEGNLNYTFHRFENEYLMLYDPKDYYDKIEIPANIQFPKENTDSKEFYNSIKEKIEAATKIEKIVNGNKTIKLEYGITCNYIVVSIGNDLENIDIAKKMSQKIKEWNANNKSIIKIFVRIKDYDLYKLVSDKNSYIYDENMIPFGSDLEIMKIDNLLKLNLENLALNRHIIYSEFDNNVEDIDKTLNDIYFKFGLTTNSKLDIKKKVEICSIYKWYYKWTQNQRRSNYYAALNIAFKMKMIGIDYDIQKIYDANGKSNIENRFNKLYKIDPSSIARDNLAIQEKYRWNAYMVCNGYIPAKISEIEKEPNDFKNYLNKKRKHANITTIKGLDKFKKHMALIKSYMKDIDKEYADLIEIAMLKISLYKANNKVFENETEYKELNDNLDKLISLYYKEIEVVCATINQVYPDFEENVDDGVLYPFGEEELKNEDVFKYDFQLMDNIIKYINKG